MAADPTNGEGHVHELDESQEISEDDLVTFTDEDGAEHRCAILAIAEVDGADYALLAPVTQLQDEESEELELFIFSYGEDEDGNEVFGFIEDEQTYETVQSFFSTLVEQRESLD
jgi:uncharacterized protein YrzB (UPF0473 family)